MAQARLKMHFMKCINHACAKCHACAKKCTMIYSNEGFVVAAESIFNIPTASILPPCTTRYIASMNYRQQITYNSLANTTARFQNTPAIFEDGGTETYTATDRTPITDLNSGNSSGNTFVRFTRTKN